MHDAYSAVNLFLHACNNYTEWTDFLVINFNSALKLFKPLGNNEVLQVCAYV